MWWSRKPEPSIDQDRLISAHLEAGDTLQITFEDDRDGAQLLVQGAGDVRLSIRAHTQIRAEIVHPDQFTTTSTGR